jgi:hypothetical protein
MLGGLMRGASGAFLRGALGTATQAIQQVNLDDQEQIENKVAGYGDAYKTYQTGLKAYEKERDTISDVANALAAQDPEYVKDMDASQLEGLAQSLILRSGEENVGKVLDYFMQNRHKLTPVAAPATPTVTAADTQTDAAMAPASAPADDRSFLNKIFTGQSEDEIKDAAAKKLGISREQYDIVMAGKVPTVDDPSMMLKMRQDGKFSKIITDRHQKVMDVITDDDFLNATLTLPDGKKVTGQDFAGTLLDTYNNYELHGGDGASLMRMQQFALTQVMPKKARDMFEFHKTNINKITAALASNKFKDPSVKTKLEEISNNIFTMAVDSKNPGFSSTANANKLNSYVLDGLKLVGLEEQSGGKPTETVQYKQLDKSITNIMTKFNSDTAGPPVNDEVAQEMLGLRQRLTDAATGPNPIEDMNALFGDVERLMNSFSEPASSEGNKKLPYFIDIVKRLPQYQHLNEEAIAEVAGSLMVANGNGIFDSDENGTFFMAPLTGNQVGAPTKVYIDTVVSGGMTTKASGKQINEDTKKIFDNNNDFNAGAALYMGVEKNPLVFTAFGAMSVAGQTYADVIGHFTNANIGPAYNRYFNAAEQAEVRRKAIAMVGSAKDRLFDDPRLSDQDLRLVLKFIAVLGEDGRGMSTGSTEALAALQGLQVALLKDNAARMYRSKGYASSPQKILPSNHSGTELLAGSFYGEDGKFKADGSMASILYQQVANGYGIQIKTKDEITAMSQADRETYGNSMAFITDMVNAALHDVKTHYIYGQTPDRASLVDMGEISDQADGTQVLNVKDATGRTTTYTIQSLEAAKAEAKARRGS